MKKTFEIEKIRDSLYEKLSECFDFVEQYGETFEADKGYNPKLTSIAKKYVENFETLSAKGQGLLLYGSYGCGKTFASHQIANALIDKGYRVKALTLGTLLDHCHADGYPATYFNNLARFDLVVLDNFDTDFPCKKMRRFVYGIINKLYEARTPFIITTNLKAEVLKNPTDADEARVYDRILERCPRPIDASASNIRYKILREELAEYSQALGTT